MNKTEPDEVAEQNARTMQAVDVLRRGGHAIGQPALSAEGHTLVTIDGRVMTPDDIMLMAKQSAG